MIGFIARTVIRSALRSGRHRRRYTRPALPRGRRKRSPSWYRPVAPSAYVLPLPPPGESSLEVAGRLGVREYNRGEFPLNGGREGWRE